MLGTGGGGDGQRHLLQPSCRFELGGLAAGRLQAAAGSGERQRGQQRQPAQSARGARPRSGPCGPWRSAPPAGRPAAVRPAAPRTVSMCRKISCARGCVDPIDETIALDAIEPFDLHRLERPCAVQRRGPVAIALPTGDGEREPRQGLRQIDRRITRRLESAMLPHGDAVMAAPSGSASPAMVAKHAKNAPGRRRRSRR